MEIKPCTTTDNNIDVAIRISPQGGLGGGAIAPPHPPGWAAVGGRGMAREGTSRRCKKVKLKKQY